MTLRWMPLGGHRKPLPEFTFDQPCGFVDTQNLPEYWEAFMNNSLSALTRR